MPSHQSIPTRITFNGLPFALDNYIKAEHHMQERYARSSNDTMKDIQRAKHSKCFDEFKTSLEWMSQLCIQVRSFRRFERSPFVDKVMLPLKILILQCSEDIKKALHKRFIKGYNEQTTLE